MLLSIMVFEVSHYHNIIKIHNSVMWDWQYFTEYFLIFPHSIWMFEIREYLVEYFQSHKTLLWIWIML
jgi:hypothetical protein